jgi:hypothetical protein
MLRGERRRKESGRLEVRRGGLGAVVPVPLVPRQQRRGGGWFLRALAASCMVAGLGWAAGNAMLQSSQSSNQDCTALAIDRQTGTTYAGPCVGQGPRLPSTLTALLPGAQAPQAETR